MNEEKQELSIALEILVATLAATSYLLTFWISRSLITSNTDLRGFILSSLHSYEAQQFLPGATADFQRSLGISENPVGLIFDWPWLLAFSVPVEYFQAVFAGITCMSLYLAVNVLGVRLNVPSLQRQIAGFVLPILMFIPGPVKWNTVAVYTASFGWTVSTLTISLVLMSSAHRRTRIINILVGFAAGMFTFWANISYLPMTLPTILIGAGFILWRTFDRIPIRQFVTFAAALLSAALLVLPLFVGVYLYGVWAIPEIAVQENIDTISSWSDVVRTLILFPGLDKLPLFSSWLGSPTPRIVAVLMLLLAIRHSWKSGQRSSAVLGLVALGVFVVYALAYSISAWFLSREIGLTPSYVEIVAYPIWLLLMVNFVLGSRRFQREVPQAILRVLPIVIILMWGAQWVARNHSLRSESAEYPVIRSETTRRLSSLMSEALSEGDFPRVIILQDQFPEDRAPEGFRIRRASDFSYSFLLELQAANIPVLNAYSHMISPRTFSLTNELFTDGRPTWRQFSLYDKPNVDRMSDFGVRYVLSEFQVFDSRLKLISVEPFKAYGLYPTEKSAYLYEVVNQEGDSQAVLKYEFEEDELLISGFSSKRRSISIPIEFSRCLTLSNTNGTSIPNMKRGNHGLVNFTFQGNLDVRLRYENSIFQWRNCRILDYLDFRRQQSTPP